MNYKNLNKSEKEYYLALFAEKAEISYRAKDYKSCIGYLNRIIMLSEKVSPDIYHIIASCYRNVADYEKAIENMNNAMILSERVSQFQLIERGISYFGLGKIELAMCDLIDGLKGEIFHPEGYRVLGQCFDYYGDIYNTMKFIMTAALQGDLNAKKYIINLCGNYNEDEYNVLLRQENRIINLN